MAITSSKLFPFGKKVSLLPDQYNRRDGNVEKIANYFVSSITQLLHG